MARHFGKSYNHAEAVVEAGALLEVLEGELSQHRFLVGDTATLADIAIYSYVARAPEGDAALDEFRSIEAWLRRVEALPRFFQMPKIV